MSEEEAPRTLSLEQLNIDWLDRWVCADNFTNRRELRENKFRWKVVPAGEDEFLSGLIEVETPEMRMLQMQERHRAILKDGDDPWSDYKDPRQCVLDEAEGIPYWIHARVEKYLEWESSVGKESVSGGKVVAKPHKGREPHLPSRCITIKKDGTRCWSWAVDKANEGRCRNHAPGAALEANMGHNIMLAKVKAMQAAPAMMDNLEEMALYAASEQVKLKATDLILGMAGVSVATDINMNIDVGGAKSGTDLVKERLADLATRLAKADALKHAAEADEPEDPNIIDVEVIEND